MSEHPCLWATISDDDGDVYSIGVPSADDEYRYAAAVRMLTSGAVDPDYIAWADHADEVIAALAAALSPAILRQHVKEPREFCTPECEGYGAEDCDEHYSYECGCPEQGWWCSEADGPEWAFFTATREGIDAAADVAKMLNETGARHDG